jgi:GNAT superfamily N-acetyltransferase
LEGKIIHLEDLVVKQKMRGTGLGYALYSEIIKQARGTMYLELIGMSLIGIPSDFMKTEQKYLETGI